MKQEYISYWKNTLHHSQILEFFRSFKSDHTTSNYLDVTGGTAETKKLVKLGIVNHKLMIELGTTIKLPEIIGIALFVDPILAQEDEVHFLFNCSKYSLIRNNQFTIKLRF